MYSVRFVILVLLLLLKTTYAADVETINICALRVEFQQDQNDLTTGNGLFMVDTVTQDPYAIDPAPHNRVYFQDQILAAANYFSKVSSGKVDVSGYVFPLEANGAYQLQNSMGYYNPNTTDAEINLGLANLFTDALSAAKNSTDSIDFSAYNLFVIFHAGVGRDVDVGYDNTPQDIPSLFITPEFLKESLGDDFDGVDIGNDIKISSGIILPETENQDGYALALTGIFVSNIGSHLGLYDLFSPSKQRAGIGRFGLMDVGLMNLNGLVPSPPGAFSRKLLGWDEIRLLDKPQNNITIKRFGSPIEIAAPTIVQVPINEDEYYLIEQRGDANVNIDSLYSELAQNREEYPTYLELLETEFGDQIERGASGVLVSVADYDWGIGGAGLLVWHVDERIIREKGSENAINDDPDYRAVDIEEADGSQDIGQAYSLLEAGYQKELGWFADFWFSNRPEYIDGFELYSNEFSNTTNPNTRSNRNQAVSHIELKNFSVNTSDTMNFDFLQGGLEDNFPVHLAMQEMSSVKMTAGIPENHTLSFLFAASAKGNIYAVDAEGNGLIDPDSIVMANINPSESAVTLALMDTDDDGKQDILFVAADDSLHGINLDSFIGDSLSFPAQGSSTEIISGPVVKGNRVAIGCADDSVFVFDELGNTVDKFLSVNRPNSLLFNTDAELLDLPDETTEAAMLPLLEGQNNLVLYSSSAQQISILDYPARSEQVLWPDAVTSVGPKAFADITGNGIYDILLNQADGIYAYNRDGFLLNGFPISPGLADGESFVGSPLILDVDSDGELDFLAASNTGSIFGFSRTGKILAGFPVSTGDSNTGTPIILQFDEDPEMELVAISDNGSLYAWQLPVLQDNPSLLWLSAYNSATNNLLITERLEQVEVGSNLMPEKRVYNYPNPNSGNTTTIRYYLNEQASVTIQIFDAAGMPVDEFNAPGSAGVDNEIVWDVSDIASGVYICRVKAKSASQTDSRIIKIMVIH